MMVGGVKIAHIKRITYDKVEVRETHDDTDSYNLVGYELWLNDEKVLQVHLDDKTVDYDELLIVHLLRALENKL
jgi:hypothetical protein